MDIRKEIAKTIDIPDFLKELRNLGQQEVVEIVYKILDLYYRGVEPTFLEEKQISRLCRRIDWLSHELQKACEPKIYFKCWIWLGDTVTKWIDISLAVENYEAATNLRKLLNSEYV